jgi:hypothetical protein
MAKERDDVSEKVEFVLRIVLVGAGATLVMDLWASLLGRCGIPSLDFALVGRWLGHLPEGRWRQERIAQATPVRAERLLGWGAHYAAGISFAGLLVATSGLDWARSPSLLPALLVGVVTVLAPWLILQPALGAGIASSRTPAPLFNAGKSLVTHIVYGVGLYLAALATAALVPEGR